MSIDETEIYRYLRFYAIIQLVLLLSGVVLIIVWWTRISYSFCDCYEAECGKLSFDDNGVPLEHLVTCVSGLELIVNNSTGIKYLTTSTKVNADDRKSEG